MSVSSLRSPVLNRNATPQSRTAPPPPPPLCPVRCSPLSCPLPFPTLLTHAIGPAHTTPPSHLSNPTVLSAMDGSSKRIDGGGADKPSPDNDQNQNASPNVPAASAAGDDGASVAAAAAAAAAPPADGRRPFTSLSQEEADLALARVLQEQVSAGDLAGSVAPRGVGACYETSPLIPRAFCRSGRT